MRLYDHGLVDQLESAFRLANRFDRKRPQMGWLIGSPLHADTQPFVGQSKGRDTLLVETLLQVTQAVVHRHQKSNDRRLPRVVLRS